MVVCTKEEAYVDDLFLAHMTKFVRDLSKKGTVESTEIIGYTKGCQTVEEVEAQRAAAQEAPRTFLTHGSHKSSL